jgi:hypothetical protein
MNRQSLIQKLKEDIAQGRVVIIAGTGVSIAACGNQLIESHPVASWPGLLQNGLEYCRSLGVADKEDAELLGNQIKSNKTKFLISAAEDISERLQSRSEGTYRGWLNDTVGKRSSSSSRRPAEISYELYCQIQLYDKERGLSFAQIGRELNLDEETVANWARQKTYCQHLRARRKSKLDPYKPIIQRWLEQHPYSATQIFQRLRAEQAYLLRRNLHPHRQFASSAARARAGFPDPGVRSGRMRASRLGLRRLDDCRLNQEATFFLCHGALLQAHGLPPSFAPAKRQSTSWPLTRTLLSFLAESRPKLSSILRPLCSNILRRKAALSPAVPGLCSTLRLRATCL